MGRHWWLAGKHKEIGQTASFHWVRYQQFAGTLAWGPLSTQSVDCWTETRPCSVIIQSVMDMDSAYAYRVQYASAVHTHKTQ